MWTFSLARDKDTQRLMLTPEQFKKKFKLYRSQRGTVQELSTNWGVLLIVYLKRPKKKKAFVL
jgi:hypothetical protein